jgi:hypothetical protein
MVEKIRHNQIPCHISGGTLQQADYQHELLFSLIQRPFHLLWSCSISTTLGNRYFLVSFPSFSILHSHLPSPYKLMPPLDGIEIPAGAPTINPLWEQGQKFSFLCFLSHYPKFSSLSVSLPAPLSPPSPHLIPGMQQNQRSPEERIHSL